MGDARHAYFWPSASPASVELNPRGVGASEVRAVGAGLQVGDATFAANPRAPLWNGSAASWVDLSLALPLGVFDRSSATGARADATTTYVGGGAREIATGMTRAILWRRPATFIGCGAPDTGSRGVPSAAANCSDGACCETVFAADAF